MAVWLIGLRQIVNFQVQYKKRENRGGETIEKETKSRTNGNVWTQGELES